MDDKYKKENYVLPRPNIDQWYDHNKYTIIKQYEEYLKGDIIDFGCNYGVTCFMMSEFKTTNKIIGVDICQESIDTGNNKIRKQCKTQEKVKLIQSNLLDIQSEDSMFDNGISFHTLEHIYSEDLDSVISEMNRVLKIGSKLLISIPYEKAFPCPLHVSFFNEKTLVELLEKHGFKNIETYKDSRLSSHPDHICVTSLSEKIK